MLFLSAAWRSLRLPHEPCCRWRRTKLNGLEQKRLSGRYLVSCLSACEPHASSRPRPPVAGVACRASFSLCRGGRQNLDREFDRRARADWSRRQEAGAGGGGGGPNKFRLHWGQFRAKLHAHLPRSSSSPKVSHSPPLSLSPARLARSFRDARRRRGTEPTFG